MNETGREITLATERDLSGRTRSPVLPFEMSMARWLSAPMIVAGVAMMAWAYRDDRATARA